jgi:hypothetical protein
MQLNRVVLEVVDGGEMFTGAVIIRNMNAWMIPIIFSNSEITI